MRSNPTREVECGRYLNGYYGTPPNSGCMGAYEVRRQGVKLVILATDGTTDIDGEEGQNWEHVSVSTSYRTPSWAEMQWVKEQFWNDDEVAFQLHPAKKDYVNLHPYCLHLWRHTILPCPLPPSGTVGPSSPQ
jgi:hypothetical protein